MTARRLSAERCGRSLAALYALLLLTAFLLLCFDYESIARSKTRVFLTVCGGFVLLTAGLALRPSVRRKPDAATWTALLYLALTVLSAICSGRAAAFTGGERRQGVLTIGLYVLSFLLLRRFLQPKQWMLDVFAAACCLFCALGLLQLVGGNPLGLYPDGLNYYDEGKLYYGSYWSTIGNVMSCGAVLSAAVGAFSAALLCRKKTAELRYALPLALCVFCLMELKAEGGILATALGVLLLPPFLVTDGRRLRNAGSLWGTGMLAVGASLALTFYDGGVRICPNLPAALLLVIGGGLFAWSLFPPKKCRADRRLRLWLGIVSAAVLCAATATVYFCTTLPDGFLAETHAVLHGRWDDGFGSGRLGIWRRTWELVGQAPLLGGGADTLGLRGISVEHYRPHLGITVVQTVDAAHNEYLNILVNQGALALTAYLALSVISFRRWRKSAERPPAAICGAAALLYGLQAFFGIADCLAAPYFWLCLAVVNQRENGGI